MFFAPSNLPQDTPKVCKSKPRTFTPPPPGTTSRPTTQSDIHRFPSSAWPPPTPPPFPFGNTSKRYSAFRHHGFRCFQISWTPRPAFVSSAAAGSLHRDLDHSYTVTQLFSVNEQPQASLEMSSLRHTLLETSQPWISLDRVYSSNCSQWPPT